MSIRGLSYEHYDPYYQKRPLGHETVYLLFNFKFAAARKRFNLKL